jgi:hypothetical protein
MWERGEKVPLPRLNVGEGKKPSPTPEFGKENEKSLSNK